MARYSQKINEALTSRNNQLKKGFLFVIKNNTNQIYVGNGRCIRWIANSVQNGDNHLLWADGGKGILWSREAWVWQRGQSREKSDCSREELSRAECAGDPEVKALDRQAFSICTSCKCPHSKHVNEAQRNHTIWTQSHSRYNSQGECLEVSFQAPLHTRKPITVYTTVTWTSTSAGVWGQHSSKCRRIV